MTHWRAISTISLRSVGLRLPGLVCMNRKLKSARSFPVYCKLSALPSALLRTMPRSLTGRCGGNALDQAAIARGMPRAITVDNRTEFTSKASKALDKWAYRRGVKRDYTRPGNPTVQSTGPE